MTYDQELKDEIQELFATWFEQARRLDRKESKVSGFPSSQNLSSSIGATQYYVSSLAAMAGRDNSIVDFLLRSIKDDITDMKMQEVQLTLKE